MCTQGEHRPAVSSHFFASPSRISTLHASGRREGEGAGGEGGAGGLDRRGRRRRGRRGRRGRRQLRVLRQPRSAPRGLRKPMKQTMRERRGTFTKTRTSICLLSMAKLRLVRVSSSKCLSLCQRPRIPLSGSRLTLSTLRGVSRMRSCDAKLREISLLHPQRLRRHPMLETGFSKTPESRFQEP